MKKRVYVIYTGGTIGMQRTPDGYAPAPGSLQKQMNGMPELRDAAMPEVTIHEYANAGVISGYDLTVEAAVAKLTYLFSRDYDSDRVKLEMQRDLRGEMTVRAGS